MSEIKRSAEADEANIDQVFELLKSKLIGQDAQVIIKVRNCLMSIAKRESPRTREFNSLLYQLNFTEKEAELIFVAAETDWQLYVKLTNAAKELDAPLTEAEKAEFKDVITSANMRRRLLIVSNINELFPTDTCKKVALKVLRTLLSTFMKQESSSERDIMSRKATVISEKQMSFLEGLDPLDQLAYSEYLEKALSIEK